MSTPALRAALKWYFEGQQATIVPIGQRTSSTGSVAATPLTIPVNTGVVNGDLVALVVRIGSANNGFATAVTTPTGFTIGYQNTAAANTDRTLMFYKTANNESGSYSIAYTNGASAVGIGQAFTLVNTTTPLDGTAQSQVDASSVTSHPTPSITPTLNNDCLLAFFTNSAGGSMTSYNNGFTQINQVVRSASQSIALASLDQATAAAISCTATSTASFAARNTILALAHA